MRHRERQRPRHGSTRLSCVPAEYNCRQAVALFWQVAAAYPKERTSKVSAQQDVNGYLWVFSDASA